MGANDATLIDDAVYLERESVHDHSIVRQCPTCPQALR